MHGYLIVALGPFTVTETMPPFEVGFEAADLLVRHGWTPPSAASFAVDSLGAATRLLK